MFLIQRFVSTVLGPHSLEGGCGVNFSPTIVARGVTTIFVSPPGGGLGGSAPEANFFGKICLVKYCNFVVNLDHSL
jgi:hypothetical protein